MTPAAAIFGAFAVLFIVCALLPVGVSAFFGYRAGERLAISIGAISGLVVVMSCGLLAYINQVGAREDTHLAWFGIFLAGVPSLCAFVGTLAGYIAIGFLAYRARTIDRQQQPRRGHHGRRAGAPS